MNPATIASSHPGTTTDDRISEVKQRAPVAEDSPAPVIVQKDENNPPKAPPNDSAGSE